MRSRTLLTVAGLLILIAAAIFFFSRKSEDLSSGDIRYDDVRYFYNTSEYSGPVNPTSIKDYQTHQEYIVSIRGIFSKTELTQCGFIKCESYTPPRFAYSLKDVNSRDTSTYNVIYIDQADNAVVRNLKNNQTYIIKGKLIITKFDYLKKPVFDFVPQEILM